MATRRGSGVDRSARFRWSVCHLSVLATGAVAHRVG